MSRCTLTPRRLSNGILIAAGIALAGPAHAQSPPTDRVEMTLDGFLKLYDEAHKPGTDDPTRPSPPTDFVFTDLSLDAEVVVDEAGEPTSIRFDGRARIDVLKPDAWTVVPLLPRQVGVLSAKVGSRPARLTHNGSHTLLVAEDAGVQVVDIVFAVPVTVEEGVASARVDLLPAASRTVRLTLPDEDGLDVVVSQASLTESRVVRGQRVLDATLPGTGPLAVSWRRAAPEDREVREARIDAVAYTLVTVGDGLLRADVTVDHSIRFAGVDRFRYAVPDGLTVLEVRGAGSPFWSVDAEGVLDVRLAYAATDTYSLDVVMEQVIGDQTTAIEAPILQPLGAERTKGFVGVASQGTLEIEAGAVTEASDMDVRTLPPRILARTSQPLLLGFKYLTEDVDIPLEVVRHDEVAVLVTLLDQVRATTMLTDDGRRLHRVVYQLRNNRRQFLRVELPEDSTLWSSAVAGKAVQPVAAEDGALLVPLIRSASAGGDLAAFEAELVFVQEGEGSDDRGHGTFDGTLPRADVPATYVAWAVYLPPGSMPTQRAIETEGRLRQVQSFSRVPSAATALQVPERSGAQRAAADAQAAAGGTSAGGTAPVRVTLPLQGTAVLFEKVLALDETLGAHVPFRG